MQAFFTQESYDCIDDEGKLKLPLEDSVVQALFGWLQLNTDLPKSNFNRITYGGAEEEKVEEGVEIEEQIDPRGSGEGTQAAPISFFDNSDEMVTISYSCMQGYKSALVYFYSGG